MTSGLLPMLPLVEADIAFGMWGQDKVGSFCVGDP